MVRGRGVRRENDGSERRGSAYSSDNEKVDKSLKKAEKGHMHSSPLPLT